MPELLRSHGGAELPRDHGGAELQVEVDQRGELGDEKAAAPWPASAREQAATLLPGKRASELPSRRRSRAQGPGRPCRQPELAQAAAMSRQHTEYERIDDTPHEPAGIEEELTALHRSWPKSKKMVASMEFSPSAGDAAHDSGGGEVPGRR